MSVVPLAAVKAFLNKTTNTDDVELQEMIDAAEAILATRIGPLSPVAVVEKHAGGGSVLVLRRWPVVSLTSVAYADGSTINLTDLDLDADAGVVYWGYGTAGRFGSYGPRGVTVTYQAGRTSLPEDLHMAVLVLTGHLWETQRGGAGTTRPSPDALDPAPTSSYLLPYRVESLIGPYRVPRVA